MVLAGGRRRMRGIAKSAVLRRRSSELLGKIRLEADDLHKAYIARCNAQGGLIEEARGVGHGGLAWRGRGWRCRSGSAPGAASGATAAAAGQREQQHRSARANSNGKSPHDWPPFGFP